MDRMKLEEWTAAERAAQEAERLVKATFEDYRHSVGAAPTIQMQQIASRRRQLADSLFHALFDREGADGPAQAEFTFSDAEAARG